MSVLPAPPPIETLALAVVCFLAGGLCPFWYFVERMQGFGRAVMQPIPYRPPPGEETGAALQRATEVGQTGASDHAQDDDAEGGATVVGAADDSGG